MLTARAVRASSGARDTLDLLRCTTAAIVFDEGDGRELVLIADGPRHLRLELRGDSVIGGPVRLSHYDLSGFRRLDHAMPSLRRLLSLWRRGRLPRSLFPRDPKIIRRVLAMQAADGSRAGATHTEIAAAVYGVNMVGNPDTYDSMRKRVARLLALADARVTAGRRRFFGP